MPLEAGTRLGPYEVVAQIGTGGMGEVYRAHDPRLGRDVAVKVSQERFTVRFAREARAIAALNHPNICQLYDVGQDFLVMELVEGPTLAERIKQGALPLEEALNVARQIAEALRAAHEKAIVHRDLKPGNVKITPDGTVKVLDFGLAKVGGTPAVQSADASTISMGPTQAGAVMGTPSYMPPEQARGKDVDKRADIWAFGVVLYEMLTGQKMFEGETISDTLAEVLKTEPAFDRVPPQVQNLVRRCLEKDPRKRLQDIGDWEMLLGIATDSGLPAAKAEPPRFAWVPWAAAALLAIALTAAVWMLWPRPVDRPLVRLDVDLGDDVSFGSPSGSDVIFSPDGSRLVYVSQPRLSTRRLDSTKATELAGTEGAFAPFFSPDSQWIGFFGEGKLKKISVDGGAAITLADAPTGRGGSWGEDGNIVANLNGSGPLMRISSVGGQPSPLTEIDRDHDEVTHRWPQVLPGNKAVLFTASKTNNAFDDANVSVMSFQDRRRKILVQGTYGRYLPGGYLVYVNRGTLFAVSFDVNKLEVRGVPVPVVEQVAYSSSVGGAQFDFSRDGTLVYRSGAAGGAQSTVQWLAEDGKLVPLLAQPANYGRPSLAPNGKSLALLVGDDVWVYDLARQSLERRTFGNGSTYPIWSPDGRFLLFQMAEGMGWTRADGASMPQRLTQTKSQQFPWSFTPDGKRMAYMEVGSVTSYDLWTVPIENDGTMMRAGKPEVFLQTPADERHPAFSPDGKWLAYSSSESGTFQVYVRAFPDKGGKWQISTNGGVYPVWSHGGRDLFFRTEENQIMVASYTIKGDAFLADKPEMWADTRILNVGTFRNFDLAPDGKRIVALMPVEEEGARKSNSHVVFLENFSDELRRRVK